MQDDGPHPSLDMLYILTNNKMGWVNTMIPFLWTQWYNVVITHWQDLELDQEQKEGGMVVDMEYAHKALCYLQMGYVFSPFLHFSFHYTPMINQNFHV